MWLLIIKNLTMSEVLDIFDEGLEYENVRDEIHIQYSLKRHLLQDLRSAKERSLKPIRYEIEKAVLKPLA